MTSPDQPDAENPSSLVDEAALHDPAVLRWGLVMETTALVNTALGQEMETEVGIPLRWFEVLLRLARAPGGQMRMSDLAAAVSFTSGGFTRLADRLADAGLIERRSCPTDRRSALAVLTTHGATTLNAALAVHVRGLHQHYLDHLDNQQTQAVDDALRTVRQGHGGFSDTQSEPPSP
jgi:DNA-binding MarR family transcriptional regulator